MVPNFNRDKILKTIAASNESWDILVIGGGATGLGVALDAVTRGYKTLLVEQSDFAKGTSSRSTKLVHGGVRYLAQGDVSLVREASIERGLLQRNAPHLVKNQTFIIPIYSFKDRIKYTIGLKLYDWIAGRLSLGASKFINKEKVLKALPGVKAKHLAGGVVYHDGQFDDARLALNIAQTITENGGFVINYAQVKNLTKNKDGKITGVELQDLESDKTYDITAKAIVNATGVFTDAILKMDDPAATQTIIASQGIHLVIDKKFYPSPHALMIPKTSDGRVLFAVPWHNHVVVGTTDTPVGQPSIEPKALEKEIEFVLKTAGQYLTAPPRRADVLSVFAGLRPLAAPKENAGPTKEISRSHKIIISPSQLFSIIGGKWTTFRKMGEDLVNTIEQQLGWPHKKPVSQSTKIHGYNTSVKWNDPLYYYGSDEPLLKKRMNGSANNWLSDTLKIHETQVRWAVQQEMARTVEDFLARRTRALLLNAEESLRICPQVATIMAQELCKEKEWVEQQIHQYTKLAQQYSLKEPT